MLLGISIYGNFSNLKINPLLFSRGNTKHFGMLSGGGDAKGRETVFLSIVILNFIPPEWDLL